MWRCSSPLQSCCSTVAPIFLLNECVLSHASHCIPIRPMCSLCLEGKPCLPRCPSSAQVMNVITPDRVGHQTMTTLPSIRRFTLKLPGASQSCPRLHYTTCMDPSTQMQGIYPTPALQFLVSKPEIVRHSSSFTATRLCHSSLS